MDVKDARLTREMWEGVSSRPGPYTAAVIEKAKRRARSDLDAGAGDWTRQGHARSPLPPLEPEGGGCGRMPRESASSLSFAQFVERYEAPNLPVVIDGCAEGWAAFPAGTRCGGGGAGGEGAAGGGGGGGAASASASPEVRRGAWEPRRLYSLFRHRRFRCGEDDEGYPVKMKLKYFLRYMRSCKDDSPMYVFDSMYNDDKTPAALFADYAVPSFFREDLFSLVGEHRRPPYRWMLIGPARSGTGVHIDPLATSAWNTLLYGRKRWVLFPPGYFTKAEVKGPDLVDKRPPSHAAASAATQAGRAGTAGKPSGAGAGAGGGVGVGGVGSSDSDSDASPHHQLPEDDEAVDYFTRVLPRVKARIIARARAGLEGRAEVHFPEGAAGFPSSPAATLRSLRPPQPMTRDNPAGGLVVEFVQRPGETVFVPGGWWHAVINLDDTLAVTQNFASSTNFERVWAATREGRRGMARKWLRALRATHPDLAAKADASNRAAGWDPVAAGAAHARRKEAKFRARAAKEARKEEERRARRKAKRKAEKRRAEELAKRERRKAAAAAAKAKAKAKAKDGEEEESAGGAVSPAKRRKRDAKMGGGEEVDDDDEESSESSSSESSSESESESSSGSSESESEAGGASDSSSSSSSSSSSGGSSSSGSVTSASSRSGGGRGRRGRAAGAAAGAGAGGAGAGAAAAAPAKKKPAPVPRGRIGDLESSSEDEPGRWAGAGVPRSEAGGGRMG